MLFSTKRLKKKERQNDVCFILFLILKKYLKRSVLAAHYLLS